MAQNITYIPPPTGAKFHAPQLGTYLYKAIRGVPGSGKTVVCVWDMFFDANKQPAIFDPVTNKNVRWSRWLIVRQTNHDMMQSTIPTWLSWFPTALTDLHKSYPIEGVFEAPSLRKDGTVVRMELIFLPAEADNFMDFLDGIEISGAYVNEAAQIAWKKIHKIQERCGRFKPPGGAASGMKFLDFGVKMDTNTPIETSWWYDFEREEQPKGMLWFVQPPAMIKTKDSLGRTIYVRNDAKNNAKYRKDLLESLDRSAVSSERVFVSDGVAENVEHHNDGWGYYEKQLVGADEDYIKRRLLNEYGQLKDGKPVYEKTWNDSVHVTFNEMEISRGSPIIIGHDFGRNPAAIIGQLTSNGQARFMREVVSFNMGVPLFAQRELIPVLINEFGYPNANIIIFGDPSGANASEMSEEGPLQYYTNTCGIPAMIPPCLVGMNNDIGIRLNAVESFLSSMVGGEPGLLLSSKCERAREGFNGDYCYESIRGKDDVYRDKPTKGRSSHLADAIQYWCCGARGGYLSIRNMARVLQQSNIDVSLLRPRAFCV